MSTEMSAAASHQILKRRCKYQPPAIDLPTLLLIRLSAAVQLSHESICSLTSCCDLDDGSAFLRYLAHFSQCSSHSSEYNNDFGSMRSNFETGIRESAAEKTFVLSYLKAPFGGAQKHPLDPICSPTVLSATV